MFFPHIFVWGSCFWFCIPSASVRPPPSARLPPPHTQLDHIQLTHTQLAHTQLVHTQLTHTHNLLTHNLLTHNLHTHTTYSHTTYSHTTCTHTQLTHTQLVHAQLVHTQFVNSFTWQLCVAGVALSDTNIHFVWQEWYLATWAFTLRGRCGILTLCGRRGTYGIGLALVACLGLSWRRGRRGFWRGRRGTWRHRASILRGTRGTYGTGLALAARLGLSWRRGRRGFLRGKRGTWWHGPSLCVAGVALGDMDRHFAWQAWHLWHWAGSGGALGSQLTPWTPRLFAWQAWHLVTWTFTLRGTRGTWRHGSSLCVAAWHLRHWAGSHTIFDTPLCHTPSFTHRLSHTIFHTQLCHTPSLTLCHTPSFTHHFVTHHFVTHRLCHTPSFTHNFVTHHVLPRHLSYTTLSHTIFHTQLCHTLSFTHNFHTPSFTPLCHTPSFTHHLWHTIFASPSFTPLCHTPSFTYNFVTHNSSHTTCFTSRSSTTSFVFPALPVPLQHLLPIIGRSWHVGLSGPLIVEWPRVALLDEAGLCRKTVVQAPKNCFFAHA